MSEQFHAPLHNWWKNLREQKTRYDIISLMEHIVSSENWKWKTSYAKERYEVDEKKTNRKKLFSKAMIGKFHMDRIVTMQLLNKQDKQEKNWA